LCGKNRKSVTEHPPEPTYEPPRQARREPRLLKPGWRTAGRIIWIAALSLLGLVVLAIVAVLVWLHTGRGAGELGRYVTDEARNAIQGDLRVGAIHVGGFLHICVDGVDLRDPDGHRVLSADRACVQLQPLALKAHRVVITEAQLERPWIEIAKVPGTAETTLQRAIKPRKPPQPGGGPFEWKVDVRNFELRGGSVTVRPELGADATLALRDLNVTDAHARYAADSAAAALGLSAQLSAPGQAPVAVDLDATLEGAGATGTIALKSFRARLGESGLVANGSWDLARRAGEIRVRQLVVRPEDIEVIAPKSPLAAAVRGEADLKSDGKTAGLDLRLEAGGGKIGAKLTATLEKAPVWDVQLSADAVDPAALSTRAPKGEVTARLSVHGKGAPRFDEHGIVGEHEVALHVGPARLDRVGPVVADVKATVVRRFALVRAFTATALGLEVKAHGRAAYDEVSLDLDVRAPDLRHFGRAVGATLLQPSLPIGGSARLLARVTGSPTSPDASVSLRAPKFLWSGTVSADGLTVDGSLHGPLRRPDGSLRLSAQRLSASAIDLGTPRVDMTLQWPVARLRIDARVAGGAFQLAGDAKINDAKDGLTLSHFLVAYPGNTLHLARDANVHFRGEVVLEPIELVGDHGSLRLQAQVQPPPGRIDAAVVVSNFELDRLPQFAMPKNLALRGVLDANAVVQGPRAVPDFDLRADVRGAGARQVGDLSLDAHVHAHVHRGVLQTDGWAAGSGLIRVDFQGELPVQAIATQSSNAPVQFEARFAKLDLARLAETAKLSLLQQQRAHGLIDARIVATGTLAAPRATVSLEAHDLGTQAIQQVDARAGLLIDKGITAFDGSVQLAGEPALALSAQIPFDLARALRDRAYLRGMLDRPLQADLAVTQLPLERLSRAGFLPPGSSGTVSLSARLSGTPMDPSLDVNTSGNDVTIGRLHGVAFQGALEIKDKVQATLGAQSQGDVVARGEMSASLSGKELMEVLRRRGDRAAISPLLDRTVSLNLDIPGLPVARASQLAGRAGVAEGRLTGRVALSGTPARPQVTGQLALRDLSAQEKKLGAADLSLEASSAGALLNVGIDPPGGGKFLGHVKLDADLGGRTLLSRGAAPILNGRLSGEVTSHQLDLGFASGLVRNLRRAGGTLDGAVKMGGTLSKPVAEGDAHLRRGLFDVVGQGVYEDVGLDAKFSPKEVVLDRLTGSAGMGTFSAILAASRKPLPGSAADRMEFTGEVHLGDAESVRDRKVPGTDRPLSPGPVPIRQAAEQRADVSGEIDLFGDYTDGVLNLNAKIPDARIVIKQLPDKKLPSLKENPDVLLVHPGERPHPPGREPGDVEAEAQALKTATFRMHAHLDLNHLYVKASDFEFPVDSKMNFEYDARRPDGLTADGTVHVPQGSFNALGRRFIIDDAKIIETGGDPSNPELEIKALYDNPQAKVTITVTGTAKDPQLEMSSNPPMDQDQIAFFLATGRIQGRATQQGGGVDLSGAATSVVGSLLFGQVRKELADVLPVDVITIDTSAKGVSGASVGKYIGDKVFIGYRQRFTETPYENNVEGHLEYEISRTISAEMTYGDRTRDFSVLFTKDF
jgi:autotransporter translocation and assembly factor TamB